MQNKDGALHKAASFDAPNHVPATDEFDGGMKDGHTDNRIMIYGEGILHQTAFTKGNKKYQED